VYRLTLVLAALVAALVLIPAAASPAPSAVPTRIISLSATATESLFAIGAGRQVIAVDDQSDYPRTAPRTKLSGFTPNVEAIAAYRPDLVIVAYDPKDLVSSLRKLHIRVLVQDAAKTLAEAYQQILQLGNVTGHRKQAAAVVARMKKRIAELVTPARRRGAGLTVYHELTPDLYSATSSTFIGRVYGLFGLRNIADAADSSGSGYPQLSAEYLVAQNPDLIVLADTVCCGQTPKTVAARPGWSGISAVRNRLIVRIDDSIASRWGPRIVNFVRAVSSALSHVAR
jgi:iron complex transport system substrate-binding protein